MIRPLPRSPLFPYTTLFRSSVETVATDASWRAGVGPILHSGNYDGESYDARLEIEGWSRPGLDDAGWEPVALGEDRKSTRLNSSHSQISYAVFCLKNKNNPA